VIEPQRSYALVKAWRMYEQCKTFEEMKIIDRYAELAQPRMYAFGFQAGHPCADVRAECFRRLLSVQKARMAE